MVGDFPGAILGRPRGPEGHMQPSLPFLPAQFLFLVLRYYDESSFSRTLAVYASVGLGLQPQLPSTSPHPHPHPSVVWTQSCRSKQKRGCLMPPLPVLLSTQLEALWWVKIWCHSDARSPSCCSSVLPSTWPSLKLRHLWSVLSTLQGAWRGE